MTTTIRAKFRCMSVTRTWDGIENCEFRPVKRDGKDAENDKFWDASPSGEAKLAFKGECGIQQGAYYYIDMTADEEGDWSAGTISWHSGGGGNIQLYRGWQQTDKGLFHGSIEIGVNYDKVLELFGRPDGKWKVEFIFAEASDYSAP